MLAGVFAIGMAAMAADRAAGRAMWGLSRGKAVERSCADFDAHELPDDVGHVVLTGCEMRVGVSSVVFSGPDLVTAYVPLQVAGRPMVSHATFLYRSEKPSFLAVLTELVREDPEDPHLWVRDRVDADPGVIDGTILRGRHQSVGDGEHLERHRGHLAADAVLLVDRHGLPDPVAPLGGALVMALLAVWGLVFPPSGITAGTGARTRSDRG